PQLFLPFYKEGIYNEANRDCIRAAGAIKNILPHVGLYIGFLAFECIRKDWRAVKVMLIMGIGFAMAFTLGAFWFRCEGAMPWWKFWEMSIGLGGGLSFGFSFYLLNEADEKKHSVLITAGERYFAMGLVVLLGIANVVASGYEGFSRLHKLDLPTSMRFLVTLGLVVIVIIAYLFWLRRSKERKSSRSHVRIPLLPTGAISMILGLIVVSGYLVSMPKNISSNIILLTIYTICILVSVVFGGILEYRSRI
ncbi:MAG: hypothetical protein KAH38_07145, partial [Candidatus Hydrogenedentes bacterium]|nr:hypothetical protein [Candidatus Hydrogenedentota bacterium]